MASKTTLEGWSSLENIFLIYVGSAADFAANPENFWLFFTNSLPSNPQQRFIETMKHTRDIILASESEMGAVASRIRTIHTNVEDRRARETGDHTRISNKAFIQVGDMLVDYGIKAYEYLNRRPMTAEQKEETYQDAAQLFRLMRIEDVPQTYAEWFAKRNLSIQNDLRINEYTKPLYEAYKKDIGPIRYWLLLQFQSLFVDRRISQLLGLKTHPLFPFIYKLYPIIKSKLLFHFLAIFMFRKETREYLWKMQQDLPRS